MNLEQALRGGPAEAGAPSTDLAARAREAGLLDVAFTHHPSPFGDLLVAATPNGVVAVAYSREDDETLTRLADRVSPRILESAGPTDELRRQLDEYFERRRRVFELPIDLALAGGFRAEVLAHLAEVPYGQTTTYADLAAESGRPRAYRAVGTTMATNPIAIVLPCHRVLPSSGGLGNYGGGVATKRSLLALEGVEVAEL